MLDRLKLGIHNSAIDPNEHYFLQMKIIILPGVHDLSQGPMKQQKFKYCFLCSNFDTLDKEIAIVGPRKFRKFLSRHSQVIQAIYPDSGNGFLNPKSFPVHAYQDWPWMREYFSSKTIYQGHQNIVDANIRLPDSYTYHANVSRLRTLRESLIQQ